MKRKFILAVLSSFVYMTAQAGFTPVIVTGFNEDIVANGSLGVTPSISANLPTGFDSGGYALVSEDYVDSSGNSPTYYLPTTGVLSSALTQGLTFQLADYSSNNALYLSNAGTSGTLTLATPQSAGNVYLVGTSASASAFDVVVTFSDATTQTFSGNEFFDWYQGTASVPGIGRVATATGLTDGTNTNPHLFELKLAIAPTNATKQIASITINKLNSATHLAIMGVTLQDFCSGTPVPGNITSTQGIGCTFYSPTLSTTGDTTVAGLAYQWQTSTDGITYSDVFGATNHTYVASVSGNVFYRDSITCIASNLWAYSPDTELFYSTPTPIVATLPYFQSFENWFGTCYLNDRPDSSWTLNPTSGNYSWRRDDQGADASWYSPDLGAYSPVSTDGSHSARFHTYFHVTGLTEGDMDLHIDLSTPGKKLIVFDYNNTNGPDYLKVELSEDGGSTFPITIDSFLTTSDWEKEILTTTSISSNAVIRFAGIWGNSYTDIGVDSLSVTLLPSCSGTPVVGTFTTPQYESCIPYSTTLVVDTPIYESGIVYQWQSSTDGINYADAPNGNDVFYTPNITQSTYYRFTVTCSASEQSSTSAATQLQLNTPQFGTATLPYFNSFENWTGDCSPVYRPDSNWVNDSTTGNDSWRRDDQGTDAFWTDANGVPDATDGGYTPASTDGDHSARFHNYAFTTIGDAPTTTGALDLHVDLSPVGTKTISFDCISTSGDDLTVSLSEDGGTTFTSLGAASNTLTWAQQTFTTNSVSPNAVIRIIGHNSAIYDLFGAGINEDIGIDSFAVFVSPDCDGMPTAGTFSNTQTFSCVPYTSVLTVDAVNAASGIVYQWQQSTDGVTFTNVPGANAPLYNANITDSIYYRFIVVCTNSNDTDISPATQFILTPQPVDTATLPYFQGFENWSGICYTHGRPDSNWSNNPSYGDASWRRNDQGDDAGWDDPTGGAYGNPSTEGNFSARFHSNAASLEEGDLDVHLNLNQPGLKYITFDYTLWNPTPGNNTGNMLIVELSENGGTSFDTLATYIGNELGWTSELLTTTSVSANAVLRFAGVGEYTAFPTANLGPDIGLDSLNVGVAPICDTVTDATVSGITQSGATISWTAAGGSVGYDVVIDQSSSTPTGTTYFVTDPPYLATGLLSGTTYYAHVRDSCGPGDASDWITIPFTTLVPTCDSVTGIAVSAITSTGANISWTAVAGTTGYEVVVSTSSANPPTGSVTGVATNNYQAAGLTDTTIYYVFVRDSCGPNSFSGWDTLSFTTLSLGIANVNSSQFDMIVYPNPAKEIVTLKVYGHVGANAKASLTDVTGRVINQKNMTTDKADFNMANLASGIYLIRYEDDDHTQVIKVNKQ